MKSSAISKGRFGILVEVVTGRVDVLSIANPSNLDVALSTRASEETLTGIRGILATSLDVALSTRASEATLASIDGKLAIVTSKAEISAAENVSGLECVLEKGFRKSVSILIDIPYDKATVAEVYVSNDGLEWQLYDVINVIGKTIERFKIEYNFVKVKLAITGIDIKILITATI